MKLKTIGLFIAVTLCLAFSAGPAKAGGDNAKSIREVFAGFTQCYNQKDVAGVIALFTDSAQIKTGWPGRMVSKQEYAAVLPAKMKEVCPVKFTGIQIEAADQKAQVKALCHFKPSTALETKFELVKTNGQWLIQKLDYF